ncbi:protein SPT2 homolog [Condylostylus longicornis]|uniref:protein SPT2 homolog n=1 Tax=Condylostylus longicornis TaxID=2530218 RepID=UPI00244DA68D|nr:protein SPT2 homolog [Condylostylus longicornis]
MDFGTLLHVAKKNSENVQSSSNKFYSTKFAPPKKESKVEKKLSDNIKKFLEKKEKEEREKAKADKEKLNNLLAMRDEKSKNKIRKMLKVTKSANRSVLDDVDPSASTVIEDGLIQPDEDDYGYVSNTAAELFKKYVDKVGQLPEEKKFSASRPATIKDLSSTKDRVKAAIIKEQEEKSGKSKTSTSASSSTNSGSSSNFSSNKPQSVTVQNGDVRKSRKDIYDPSAEREAEEQRKKDELAKKAKLKNNRPAPPPLDFQELLKLAEKKQFEPVELKVDEAKKEPERLLTKKERQEFEERKKYLEEKERRKKLAEQSGTDSAQRPKMQPNGKIPKINSETSNSIPKLNKSSIQDKKPQKDPLPKSNTSITTKPKSLNNGQFNGQRDLKESQIKSSKDIKSSSSTSRSSELNSNASRNNSSTSSSSSKTGIKPSTTNTAYKSSGNSLSNNVKSSNNNMGKELLPKDKKLPSTKDTKTREFPPKDIQKTREFPPKDVQKTRQFPPPDVRRSKPEKKPLKRRILDDDDEEYDSEMDDFIDDGPEETYGGGYSKYIKEIFGYDKSRYRDEEFDDNEMESSFAQQMREETISRKIGLMEDLEDMKKEAEEKKRKFDKMKKMRHK